MHDTLVVTLLGALVVSVITGLVAIFTILVGLQRQIGDMRAEMTEKIDGLRAEMHREIGRLRAEMHRQIGALAERITRLEVRAERLEVTVETRLGSPSDSTEAGDSPSSERLAVPAPADR